MSIRIFVGSLLNLSFEIGVVSSSRYRFVRHSTSTINASMALGPSLGFRLVFGELLGRLHRSDFTENAYLTSSMVKMLPAVGCSHPDRATAGRGLFARRFSD